MLRTLYRRLVVGRLRRSMNPPLFVVGAGRSGTTALYQALNEHSEVLFPDGESPLACAVGSLAYEYRLSGQWDYYRPNTGLSEEELRRELGALVFDVVWGNARRVRRPLPKETRPRAWSDLWRIHLWGGKTYPDRNAADGLSWLFPGCRFVYIFRNGIDAVYSMSKYAGFRERTFEERCRYWAENTFKYEYFRRDERAVAVRFEEFVESPEPVLRAVLRHAGLRYEDGPLRYASGTVVHPLDQGTTQASAREVLKSRPPGYLQWSEEQCRTFEAICGEAMALLGYPIPF